MNIKLIDDPYSLTLATEIRSEKTEQEKLKEMLLKLGNKIGTHIVSDYMISKSEVTTPMEQEFKGFVFSNTFNLVYSTKDDYRFFAKGISDYLPSSKQGYFDFQGARGLNALTQPIRAVSHPTINTGFNIDTIIIAKAVLATGCTAISLAKNIINKYHPNTLIIATAFYSQSGLQELYSEIPTIKSIYAVGTPDLLNENGMLIPGVGNLDSRLTS